MVGLSPSVLYKYLMKEHLDTFFKEGIIRLGTLFEFRNEEFHGSAVGDADEGRYTKVLGDLEEQEFDLLSNDPRAVFARQVFKGWDEFPDGVKLKIRMMPNSRLELYGSSQNYFMHCTSLEYSNHGMTQMGYDSCIAITNPYMFFLEISKSLNGLAKFEVGSSVVYSNRVMPYNRELKTHPAFVKPESYEYQKEFRALWSFDLDKEVDPIIIRCPDARQYCEKYRG